MMKKVCHTKTNKKKKKPRVAILISDRADFKIRKTIRVKEEHYIMIKRSIFQGDTILNVYEPQLSIKMHLETTNRSAKRDR